MQDQYKYHLKDKKKEKLLSQLCKNQNAFLEALQLEAKRIFETNERDIVFVSFGDLPDVDEYTVRLTRDDIIKINEYNPKIWNNFLNVTPPKDIALRLNVYTHKEYDHILSTRTQLFCAIYDGYDFYIYGTTTKIHLDQEKIANGDLEVRFKAWDD